MIRHFIIIASSYKLKTRIALDYIYDRESREEIGKVIRKIKGECGQDVHISTHSVMVKSERWDAVVESDPFFEQIKVLDTVEQFIMYANQDKVLTGNEIGEYLLSKVTCDHLKLEKLVYFCYADYLCKTKRMLFENKIFAFEYGPVVEDVYKRYRNSGGRELNNRQSEFQLSLESRILNSEDGVGKLQVINDVLAKYGHLSAHSLVGITHKEGTPWRLTYDGALFKEISNKLIMQNHCYETTINI